VHGLAGDFLRARYRESPRREKLVTAGVVEKYEFRTSWFSRRVAKGSRLRLMIKSPNSFGLERNYNGGGKVADESGKDARTAHVRVWHDAAHASYLELPAVKNEPVRAER
jgi:predicted acyl esterase